MMQELEIYIMSFFIYGFIGWIWESVVIRLVKKEKMYNRGFLVGPILPIYGFGAILVILLFDIRSVEYPIYALFLLGGNAACLLEYITSYVMEKLFHHRWWDYSQKPFNINGRVYLNGFICFGIFSVVAIRFAQPFLTYWISKINAPLLFAICSILVVIFIIDIIATLHTVYHLEEHIKQLSLRLEQEGQKLKSLAEEKVFIKNIIMSNERLQYRQKRLLKAFPSLIKNIKGRK